MDSDNIKWLIGTAIALVGVFIAYLSYLRSTERDTKERDANQRVSRQRQIAPLLQTPPVKRSESLINYKKGIADLQDQLDVINPMVYPNERQRELEWVVNEAIQRGEFQFALEVINMMYYPTKAQRCKEVVLQAKRKSDR